MNILLIYLNPFGINFQIGLAYIASMLEARKHKVSFLFLSQLDKGIILEEIKKSKAQFVFISVTSDSFELCKNLVNFLKRETKLPILLGGIHPTISPQETIGLEEITGICVGEGEYPACEFVEAFQNGKDFTKISNIWVKENGKVFKNEIRPLVNNLDDLPPPSYEIFKKDFKGLRILPVMLSRGCPFNCSYCCNHTLRRLYQGKGNYLRNHGVSYSIKLIKYLLNQFPEAEKIEFFDDTFTLDNGWFRDFLSEYSRLGVKFICNSRFDLINEEMAKLLANSGCIKINLAVECGNEKIREEVLRRKVSNREILDKAKLLKKYDIGIYTHNMVGVPYETEQDIRRTVQLNRSIKPDAMQVSVFNPYPNSDLGNLCLHENWVNSKLKPKSFHDFTVLNTPYVKPHIVDYYLIAFEAMVYDSGISLKIKNMMYWLLHFNHNRMYLMLRGLKTKKPFSVLAKYIKI